MEKLQEYAQAGLGNYWVVDEHPFRADDGIVARYVNENGSLQLRDTVTLSELADRFPVVPGAQDQPGVG